MEHHQQSLLEAASQFIITAHDSRGRIVHGVVAVEAGDTVLYNG